MTLPGSIGIKVPMELFLFRFLMLTGTALLVCGCASEQTVRTEKRRYDEASLEARFTRSMAKGTNGGSPDQRSEFESKVFGGTDGKKVGKKDFTASRLDMDRKWDGRKDFSTSGFADAGKVDSAGGKAFQTKESGMGTLAYSGQGKEFNTRPSDVSKDSWYGAGRKVDTFVDKRTQNTPNLEPPVSSFREYARKTVEDTNSMLGRKVQ